MRYPTMGQLVGLPKSYIFAQLLTVLCIYVLWCSDEQPVDLITININSQHKHYYFCLPVITHFDQTKKSTLNKLRLQYHLPNFDRSNANTVPTSTMVKMDVPLLIRLGTLLRPTSKNVKKRAYRGCWTTGDHTVNIGLVMESIVWNFKLSRLHVPTRKRRTSPSLTMDKCFVSSHDVFQVLHLMHGTAQRNPWAQGSHHQDQE